MQIHSAPQGSDDWHRARAGKITASMFRICRERLKSGKNQGQPSAAAEKHAFRLAVERISGLPLDEGQFETYAMRRGHELEPFARERHEQHAGVTVDLAGFVTTDCGRFGASADGLIGADGGAEYKCLISPEAIRDAVLNDDISDYLDQVQGGMWITGREWWDFCIYCPALSGVNLDFTRWRVPRDDDYIATLVQDLEFFDRIVEGYIHDLRKRAAA